MELGQNLPLREWKASGLFINEGMKRKKEPSKKRMQPLSMYPLKPEEALTAFMEIDKKKLLRAEKKAKKPK